jgi:hypothetical protein
VQEQQWKARAHVRAQAAVPLLTIRLQDDTVRREIHKHIRRRERLGKSEPSGHGHH